MATFLSLLAFVISILFLVHLNLKRDNKRRATHVKKKGSTVKVRGTVVLMKKHYLDMTHVGASIVDRIYELFGQGISFQLVSSTVGDSNDRDIGSVSEPSYLEGWITKVGSMYADELQLTVNLNWDKAQGVPGAVIVKNNHRYEFYLKTLTLEGVPSKGRMHFVCDSWVYPADRYSYDRIFFSNDTYLPSNTPKPLRPYREDELKVLRGDGSFGKFKEHDRVFDYDLYNDLGDPSMGKEFERPILGGSKETPYPRRGRTSRPITNGDYLPCDEYFGRLKYSDFIAFKLKSNMEMSEEEKGDEEFNSLKDTLNLYKGKMKMPDAISRIIDWIPFELLKELLRTDGEQLISFPLPQVITKDDACWATDKEFARQMIAGLHPVLIRAAKEEEIADFMKHQDRSSSHMYQKINNEEEEDEEDDTNEWVEVASNSNDDEENNDDENSRFFVLDHSYVKKYQNKIQEITSNKVYATKTLLYLENDGTLSPKGISLTKAGNEDFTDRYFFPAEDGVNGALWKLAKAFVVVNDSGCHQLISHWLYTHAAIEPFVIATNRQLSVMHPVHKLLKPHFRDTLHMNSLARQILIHAGGVIETSFFPGKYAMTLTSEIYKSWNLMEHALPTDLCNRGVASRGEDDKLRLLIEDYPYAVDGLEIWAAIEAWVHDYCSIYYPDDHTIQADPELQDWWKEIREVGHGDLKDRAWWPTMQSVTNLCQVLTILIWLASAFHAALNFGQWAYSGYVPNRPTFIRRPMPDPEEYDSLKADPEGFFLKTITSKSQALSVMGVIEILSRHSSDEVYLGQREDDEWTSDQRALDAFRKFHNELLKIERNIEMRNKDERLKNRRGDVEVPYTLLYPDTSNERRVAGLTGKGIPNSVSV